MGFDTKYRPLRYKDVCGQDSIKRVLRKFVSSGRGFDQSYLFAGPYGSGKTTLGRILARSLLCDNPQDGESCGSCDSCLSILKGSSENFVEFDAATNSGKSEIKKILEEIQYTTFSGGKRLYLMDEAHRLSKDALDALLKPMEEGKLVCIFATTEPEKMRATVISRCAPTFVIESVEPSVIAERLSWVCEQEGISYEKEALEIISAVAECHIRDALKSLEGISMMGSANVENVCSYLHLSLNDVYIDILLGLEENLSHSLSLLEEVIKRVSPFVLYEKFSQLCLLAYQVKLGVIKKIPVYWNHSKILELSEKYGESLVSFSIRFSEKPSRVTKNMLICDLSTLLRVPKYSQIQEFSSSSQKEENLKDKLKVGEIRRKHGVVTADGTYIDVRAANIPNRDQKISKQKEELTIDQFNNLVELRLEELERNSKDGSARSNNLGDSGTFEAGGVES